MTAIPAVSDGSALSALAQIDQLELLRGLFGRIVVPPAALAEHGFWMAPDLYELVLRDAGEWSEQAR